MRTSLLVGMLPSRAAALILLVLLAVGIPVIRYVAAKPILQIERPSRDAGIVFRGAVVRERFALANTGSGVLTVVEVDAECGATATLLSGNTILPGQSGEIEFVVDTSRIHAAGIGEEVTPLRKNVTVTTNARGARSAVLTLSATIESELFLSEPLVRLENGRAQPKTISLRFSPKSRASVLGVHSTIPELRVALVQDKADSSQALSLAMDLEPNAQVRWLSGNIVVTTSSTASPELRIPVRGAM